jgi:hypothetical protein
MANRNRKSHPAWTDVKAKLDSFDRAGLLGLVQNLYTAQADTRTFLHARFGLTENVLLPYKRTEQWLSPEIFGKEDISVSKAKKAISDDQKAVDQPEGSTELMVFYGEVATDFCDEFGMQDEGTSVPSCGWLSKPPSGQTPYHPPRGMGLWRALIACGLVSHNLGYGVGAEMDFLLSEYGVGEG